jgi:uncharacterized protein YndB with AHSA1/START domain
MIKLILWIDINAGQEVVWNAITQDAHYRKWTKAFDDSSRFEGGWNAGDEIRFIGMDKDGNTMGMVSEIAESRYPEYISIRHLGYLQNDVVDTTSDAVREWAPSYENYRLENTGENSTRFHLEMDVQEKYLAMFEIMWPKAMGILKDVSEENAHGRARITVNTLVSGSADKIWSYWTDPAHICAWNAASPEWHCPHAENDLRTGGTFTFTMAAKDGSMSFDFNGVYTAVESGHHIAYTMEDGRMAEINFSSQQGKVMVTETFDPEQTNSYELQRTGWQAILDNFRRHAEAN